jgi:hypothetical protein
VELATIFYSLRFETSLFVASYDSQGYGGGIRACLHTQSTPVVFFLTTLHGPSRKHRLQKFLYSYMRLPSNSPDIDMFTCFRAKVFTEQLPSNGYCSQSHRSTTGPYATIMCLMSLKYQIWWHYLIVYILCSVEKQVINLTKINVRVLNCIEHRLQIWIVPVEHLKSCRPFSFTDGHVPPLALDVQDSPLSSVVALSENVDIGVLLCIYLLFTSKYRLFRCFGTALYWPRVVRNILSASPQSCPGGGLPPLHIIESWRPQCSGMLLSVCIQQLGLFLPATTAHEGLEERSGTMR